MATEKLMQMYGFALWFLEETASSNTVRVRNVVIHPKNLVL